MLNVLVSYPSWDRDQIYLPYVFGLLKTYCDRDPRLAKNVNWRMPIYGQDAPEVLLRGRDPSSVDVLALSCYTWNWFLQKAIARRVKRANPGCLVVAGGPHCDYEDPDFFRENPWLDVVVKQDGEVPFRELLRQRLRGRSDPDDIPGLYVPDEHGRPRLTAPPRLLSEEEIPHTSPYEAQSEYFRHMLEEARETASCVWGLLETNRGCPYRCSFCDWGSLTFSTVRKYSMQRIKEDIRWLTSHGVPALYLTDANVGIFERDVEIMDYLGRQKEKHGAPRDVIYSPTKSRATHLPEIMETTFDRGLKARACFPLQHTDDGVLEALDRRNLPDAEIRRLVELANRRGIPVFVQLILGCPADTYEKWKRCLADLMERGIDGDYFVFDFDLLPNAPAARESYRRQWEIETTTVEAVSSDTGSRDDTPANVALRRIVTSTSTFDEDDWCEMWIYIHAVRSFHCLDLTRKLARYLHSVEDVSFGSFYDGLVEDLGRDDGSFLGILLDRIREVKRTFLEHPDFPHDRVDPEGLPEYPFRIVWREWLFLKCALHADRFYRELADWLVERFSVNERRVRDLVRYQRGTLVTPDYDPRRVRRFHADYDWREYFDRPRQKLEEPPRAGRWRFRVTRDALGADGEVPIEWHRFGGKRRVEAWFKTVVRWATRRSGGLTTFDPEKTRVRTLSERVRARMRRAVGRFFSR